MRLGRLIDRCAGHANRSDNFLVLRWSPSASHRPRCAGNGSPTVVVDQGQGLSIERSFSNPVAAGWAKVFNEVRKFTRICMHDRAGLGWSDAALAPRNSFDMVKDLRTVLRKGDIAPPYVLVGHSIGGFNARIFASQYPDEVVGMVLVDSSHPDQIIRFMESLPAEAPGEIPILQGFRRWPKPSISSEGIDLRTSADQVRITGSLGAKPLIVLSQSPNALRAPGVPSAISETIQNRCDSGGAQYSTRRAPTRRRRHPQRGE